MILFLPQNGHQMAQLKINKGTNRGKTKFHKGQIASVVVIKNDGNGIFRLRLLNKLNIKPTEKQHKANQSRQRNQKYNRVYNSKPNVKHKRNINVKIGTYKR